MILNSQFFRFAQVGVVGFVVDWACLSIALWLGTGFFIGRAISYFCAATTTWALNRKWTFASDDHGLLWQWAKFLSANSVGGAINYGVSAVFALTCPALIRAYPVLAVAAGSLAGLLVNFGLSKKYVFRQ